LTEALAMPDRLERMQTATLASWTFGGAEAPALDDPAEAYHEASKIYPSFAGRDTSGVRLLESTPQLQLSAVRGIKRHPHYPSVPLPAPALPPVSLAEAIGTRASGRSFAQTELPLGELATLLDAAYGVTHATPLPDGSPGQPLRAVPSGGALYPLELYVLAQRVESLERGVHHYDPWRHVLERLPRGVDHPASGLTAFPELLEPAGALILVTAMFWRTRFKYALRGYRFALLEAGHLGQNLLLAAAALGIAAVPVGGVYDQRVEEVLGVDGVNESLVYVFAVGAEGGAEP
jgi:SagB-type dehydrogenase family enzyme